ncbi:MAG: nucleoside-diphosphate sugar epimerase/dehydratase [Mariprofundaceae bacterium]
MKAFFCLGRWLAFIHDLAWIPLALLLAFWVRFNFEAIPAGQSTFIWKALLVCLVVQSVSYWLFSLYRGIWRFASIPDLFRIMRAVIVGTLVAFAILFIWIRLEGMPRSVMLLYPMFLLAGLSLSRLSYRWFKDHHMGFASKQGQRTLVIGAGQAGELLLRELLKQQDYEPVGLLDDNRHVHGLEIHGVRVLGSLDLLEQSIESLSVDMVLLAIPSAKHEVLQKMIECCAQQAVSCRMLPSLSELTDGKVSVQQLREIRIEDLLGRDEIILNDQQVKSYIKDCCVLVTGAGGSIGSELCRQILGYKPTRLLMLDHGEYNLYNIDQELGELNPCVEAILGDIRDEKRMGWIFEHYKPDVVFNAAAYKHVPLVEANPAEGVKTNVLGTCRLADIAVEFACGKFIQVSTDKAVNPANVMGASKRAAEIYCQNLNARQAATGFITTRFGNVLGSAGSVVPLFKKQIAKGGPVTVTHPEMTRYFMTIPEAVSLILQAGSMGVGGEIFVLDMGKPVKIIDLAEQMIRLSGMQVGVDIDIQYSGLRAGEKLYEELFHEHEPLEGTGHPKIMLSASRKVDWQQMQDLLTQMRVACEDRQVDRVKLLLKQLVPEFSQQQN